MSWISLFGRFAVVVLAAIFSFAAFAAVTLDSPSKRCRLTVDTDVNGRPTYALTCGDKVAIAPSFLGLSFKESQHDFRDGFGISGSERKSFDESWKPVWGEEDEIRDRHEELLVNFTNAKTKRVFAVRFRLFDDGLGFRYEFPLQSSSSSFLRVIWRIKDELTEFTIPGDPKTWWIPCDFESQEYDYHVTKASEIGSTQKSKDIKGSGWWARGPMTSVQTALMLKLDNGLYVNLHEAACSDFATLNLDYDATKGCFRALLVPSPDGTRGRVTPPCGTPWRTVIVSEKATDILASRITLNLNEPCALTDTSWIKPLKYVGVWWEMMAGNRSWAPVSGRPEMHPARTDNVKRYIDFAAKYGFDALLIEGWNIPYGARSVDGSKNVRDFSSTYDDVDMEEIARYSREKGVPLCLHSETSAGVSDFERLADYHYDYVSKHNANSVKLGYVSTVNPDGVMHYSQWMNNHYLYTVKKAAEHKIMVNQHEAVRPTGLCRTWPNLISNESARGQEFDSFGHVNTFHTTILPFTRLVGGPMDYTPGIVEPNLKSWNPRHRKTYMSSTVCRQLALYVVMPSPLQMAADLPENYEKNHDLFDFIVEVPVDWSQSVYLDAEPGSHVVTARRAKGKDDWYVGGSVGDDPYVASFKLSFLTPGKKYRAKLWADGKDASWDKNPTSRVITEREVTHVDEFVIPCAPGGGFALSIREINWRDAERPLINAHRGSRHEYDDNAAEGFVESLKSGVHGFETDIRITKDKELIIMHDKDVSRTTTGTGDVHAMTMAEVTALTLKKSGKHVPTARRLLETFRGVKGIRIELEMKESTSQLGDDYGETYCRKLHDLAKEVLEPGTYAFTSFNFDTLKTMKRLFPSAPIGAIFGKPLSREQVDKAAAIGCCGIAPLLKGTTKELIDYAHTKGLVTTPWMVQNYRDYAKAYAIGSDTGTSDYAMSLLKKVKAKRRLICLDLDATLCQHRSPVPEANFAALKELMKRYKCVMVGAGNAPRIHKQMGGFPIDIIGNYGMQEAIGEDGDFRIVRAVTNTVDREFFREKTDYLRKKYGYTKYEGEPLEFHASGMVTFGLLGTSPSAEHKVAFDPDRKKRKAMYKEVCEIFKGYSVFIGGSTSFDFAGKQYNKYDAIMDYAKRHGYALDEIVFIGDDFGDGGGDSHVRIKGMDYIEIEDYRDFPRMVSILLK